MQISYKCLSKDDTNIPKKNMKNAGCFFVNKEGKKELRVALGDKAKGKDAFYVISCKKDKARLLKLIKKHPPKSLLVLYDFSNFSMKVKEMECLLYNLNFHEDLFEASKDLSPREFYKFLKQATNIKKNKFKLESNKNTIEQLFKYIIDNNDFEFLKHYYIEILYNSRSMFAVQKTTLSRTSTDKPSPVCNNYSKENENSNSILIHELGHLILACEFGFKINVININNFMPFVMYQIPTHTLNSTDEVVVNALKKANIIIGCAGLANEKLYANNKFGNIGKLFGASNDIESVVEEYNEMDIQETLDDLYTLSKETLLKYNMNRIINLVKYNYGDNFVLYREKDIQDFLKLINLTNKR